MGYYNLFVNGVWWGYNPLILTIDPNFLGHPSRVPAHRTKPLSNLQGWQLYQSWCQRGLAKQLVPRGQKQNHLPGRETRFGVKMGGPFLVVVWFEEILFSVGVFYQKKNWRR